MLLPRLIGLSVLLSFSVNAGKVTIEKSDSLIRNDLFDQKRQRAEEYKEREDERNRNNEAWSYRLAPGCGLLRNHYLIYRCADGRYFKGYEDLEHQRYRQLSEQEVKKLSHRSE
ncbi:hypothetical protein [Psychromonas ossibalaenae]|uniref:hypothetical protein n=1 Tax=Psychromonas ossibalaenae TaxID=444922 RepID=UPI00038166D2|nr:hypothetical protein [Psychromonas ossibalaenae]